LPFQAGTRQFCGVACHDLYRKGKPLHGDLRLRFEAKIDKTGECWTWTAHQNSTGYGRFYDTARGRLVLAHRLSWELHRGPVPKGLCVCHHCDNRLCVRPDHLFLGTYSDNMKDMMRKGRGGGQFPAKGSDNGGHRAIDPTGRGR